MVLKQDSQKRDDAEVPTHLWDRHLKDTYPSYLGGLPLDWEGRMEPIREFLLRRWRRNLTRSFVAYRRNRLPRALTDGTQKSWHWTRAGRQGHTWTTGGQDAYRRWWRVIRSHPSSLVDMGPGLECLRKAAGASWWDWDEGSRLFFWQWPAEGRTWARDGQPHLLLGTLPRYQRSQKPPKSERDRRLVCSKLEKVRSRGYIAKGQVKSLTHFFYVPKGSDDIRMVYNGTSSGLNDCLFAPHFGLPVIRHTLRSLQEGYHQADIDIAEMFLNFNLGSSLQPYSGVDLSSLKLDARGVKIWERWTRNFMGLRDSPYRSIQLMIMAKREAYGDHRDQKGPFHWGKIVLNLPGTRDYDPTLPWVMKVRYDGHLACEVYVYVDDGKVTGWNRAACWAAASRFSKIMARLGIQDASRKRTEPSTTPGPWAGSVAHTQSGVELLVSLAKWEKARLLVEELSVLAKETMVDRKRLEQTRGYLIYVSRTYRWMVPYLKGLHLTIDSWREDRDDEGYRRKRPRKPREEGNWTWRWLEERWIEQDQELQPPKENEVPEMVHQAPRLAEDIHALLSLTSGSEPARVNTRPQRRVDVVYMMGDASGRGFGTAVWDEGTLYWESGHFSLSYREESSNFREAANLVLGLEDMERDNRLASSEVFVFTDNSVFEGTFYKGHSNSKKLNGLILRVRQTERRTGCVLHVLHVAGTRMKAAGVDGLSRGDLIEGMMKSGSDPMRFLPLSQGALDRAGGGLEEWVRGWWRDSGGKPWFGAELRKLDPEDWFLLHTFKDPRLWSPPPAAMETVLELFNEDHLVNPQIPHVFLVPCLMTHLWCKQLSKDADVLITLDSGNPSWPREMHEPLLLLIVLPLSHVPSYSGPWVAKGTEPATRLESQCQRISTLWRDRRNGSEKLHDLEGKLPGLWNNAEEWVGSLLCKFFDKQRRFPPVRQCLVRGVLQDGPGRSLPGPRNDRRRSRSGTRPRGRNDVPESKKRRSSDGSAVRVRPVPLSEPNSKEPPVG